jgi:RNA polymerase sigma-70 factor (ECF subfamily)
VTTATPEELAMRREVRELLNHEIDGLPEAQRVVVTLRDVEGWDSPEVCNVLAITEVHQRVLLHRARAKLRSALEKYLGGNG